MTKGNEAYNTTLTSSRNFRYKLQRTATRTNLYAWCHNNPVNRVDPSGMTDYLPPLWTGPFVSPIARTPEQNQRIEYASAGSPGAYATYRTTYRNVNTSSVARVGTTRQKPTPAKVVRYVASLPQNSGSFNTFQLNSCWEYRGTSSSWGTSDFVRHYWGNGGTVNLGDVGLGRSFQESASVSNLSRQFMMETLALAHDGYSSSDRESYEVEFDPGLYVLGSGNLNMAASCNANVCNFNFWIRDYFTDPFEGQETIGYGFDLPFSQPYPINHDWEASRSY